MSLLAAISSGVSGATVVGDRRGGEGERRVRCATEDFEEGQDEQLAALGLHQRNDLEPAPERGREEEVGVYSKDSTERQSPLVYK